jgi:hypothetical protein
VPHHRLVKKLKQEGNAPHKGSKKIESYLQPPPTHRRSPCGIIRREHRASEHRARPRPAASPPPRHRRACTVTPRGACRGARRGGSVRSWGAGRAATRRTQPPPTHRRLTDPASSKDRRRARRRISELQPQLRHQLRPPPRHAPPQHRRRRWRQRLHGGRRDRGSCTGDGGARRQPWRHPLCSRGVPLLLAGPLPPRGAAAASTCSSSCSPP